MLINTYKIFDGVGVFAVDFVVALVSILNGISIKTSVNYRNAAI